MKAKASPLRLKQFELLQSNYRFIIPEEEVIEDINELFDSYGIDIDFAHKELDNGLIHVLCKVEINTGKNPKSGYSMLAEASGLFSIENTTDMDEAKLGNLRYYSTLNMMINNLRNILFQQSNIGPMKGYLLPPIDIMDLFEKKRRKPKDKI